jgi:hypothetical protein
LEEHKWAFDTSVKAGLEFGHPNPGHRRFRLMAEFYKQTFQPYQRLWIDQRRKTDLN